MVDRTRSQSVRARAAAPAVQPELARLSRPALLLGTALGCSIAVFALGAPGQAFAANDCGAVTSAGGVDTATCTPGTYPSGIHYSSGQGLSVILESGVTVTNTTAGTVVGAYAAAGHYVSVYTASGDVVSSSSGPGIFVGATGGEAYIDNGADVSVVRKGLQAYTSASGGNVSIINTGNITVGQQGALDSLGIVVGRAGGYGYLNNSGTITVTSTQVGFGLYLDAYAGSTVYNSGNITVTGVAGAVGIQNDVAFFGSTAPSGSIYLKNSGEIYAHATGATGEAIGIDLGVTSGDLVVVNSGNITAIGGYSYGVYLNAKAGLSSLNQTGDVTATGLGVGKTIGVQQYGAATYTRVVGDVTATSIAGTAIGIQGGAHGAGASYAGVRVYGDVSADGGAEGIGILVTGPGANTIMIGNLTATSEAGAATGVSSVTGIYRNTVYVSGDVAAHGATGATGVYINGEGYMGVRVGGSLTATSTSGYATGVEMQGDSDGGVSIGGDVNVSTGAGRAIGVDVDIDGYAHAAVAGNVTVSGTTTSYGAYIDANNGDRLSIGGDVSVTSTAGGAYGVHGYTTNGASTVSVGGDVIVSGASGAGGVVLEHDQTGDSVSIGGSVSATSTNGYAVGVSTYSAAGNSTVSIGGDVFADATHSGDAVGVSVKGDSSIYIGGNAVALSAAGNATAVTMTSTGGAYVTVHQNVYAKGGVAATGVYDKGDGYTTVTVGGDLTALAGTGNATGVHASSKYGAGYVSIGGDLVAESGGRAVGVRVTGATTSTLDVGGNVTAVSSNGYSTAVQAFAGGDVDVTIGGTVMAIAATDAYGFYVGAGSGHADVTVGGDVIAQAGTGGAWGARVSGDEADITIGGNVSAYSTSGFAIGVRALTNDDATITIDGSVYAKTASGTGALGVEAISFGGGQTTITVAGPIVVKGEVAYGVDAVGYGGGIDVSVGDVTVKQYGATNPYEGAGIRTYTSGVTNITAHDIYTTGQYTDGVRAGGKYGLGGDTYVTANQVVTKGGYSVGIDVYGAGNATVHSGSVFTYGNRSDGIFARSGTGGVNVTSGTVVTHGDYSYGIYAAAGGPVVVHSTYVSTSGTDAFGIAAFNQGFTPTDTVAVYSGTVITHGDFSTGIFVGGYYAAYLNSGLVKTYGGDAKGIFATAYNGPLTVKSGAVETFGGGSTGIYALSTFGVIDITSNAVITQGFASYGIQARSFYADVNIDSTYVRTYGDFSAGIIGDSYTGNVAINSGGVRTAGYFAAGIDAHDLSGNVSVNSTYVRTDGDYSDGIYAVNYAGNVTIDSATVRTYGAHAIGVLGASVYGDVAITSTYVSTQGDYADGVVGSSRGGNVSINSGTVFTHGAYATGVYGYSYDATVNVISGYVRTYGYRSEGIHAYGFGGVTINSGTVITSGDYADGIHAIANDGVVNVTSDYVRTSGTGSIGIYAYGVEGVNVDSGTVETAADFATGILAISPYGQANVTSNFVVTHGDFAPGISAYGYYGATVNNTGLVDTFGYRSGGIVATAYEGDVNVNSYDVVTHGDYSDGISAKTINGNANVRVYDGVWTYGYESIGVYAASFNGNASVYNYGTIKTHGYYSDGILAGSFGGEAYIYNGGLIETFGYGSNGALAESIGTDTLAEVVNRGEIISYGGAGIVAESLGGYAEVINLGLVYGRYGGVIVESSEGSYIYNHGVIEGGEGYAIGAFGAPVTIENKGRIYGYALLHTSNNVINNQGTWFAYGNSLMGYANDVVNNKGVIDVAPLSLGFTNATTVEWDGVTVFNNSNLVDLRNGHTGDIFILNGTTWNGLAGSTLGVDASLSTSLHSDEMIIGAANGSTALVVNDTTPTLPGALNFTGTTVVHGTSGSASNFTWVGRTKGFINYELEFFSGPVDWNIVALPSNAAFEMLKAPEMAQDFWRRTGDAWSAREQEVRDSMWGSTPPTRGEGWEMWAQAQVGGERLSRTETFDVQGQSFSPNLGTDSDWRGFQMGGDNWTSKNWLWGFTGGFLEQNSVFHFDKNSLDITGWNVGAYTGFTSGAFFANGLIKGDWYDVKANMHTVPAIETFSGNTWGVKGEAGFRFGTNHLYFEPLADIAWTSTHLDNANFPMQDTVFTFGNATSTRGSIGARVGGQWGSILPYVGIYAAQEFDGKNKMSMITGGGCPGCSMDITDLKPGSYERADFGFTTTSWNGLEGFLKGEAEFGGHTDGFTGRLGVRWRW